LAARFSTPTGIAVDRQGVVFIADVGNYAVRKMTPDYVVSTVAGGTSAGYIDGTSGNALFYIPTGIVAADNGTLFVADGNSVIRTIDTAGTVSTLLHSASEVSNSTQFGGVIGSMSMSQSGSIYLYTYPVTFISSYFLHTIDPKGQLTSVRTSPGITAMAVDRVYGGLYVANNSGEVSRMAPDGKAQVLASGFGSVRAMVFDSVGMLYVAEWGNCTISTVAANGAVKRVTGKAGSCAYQDGPEQVARLVHPGSLAADNSGNIYIGDDSFTIRKLAPDGSVSTVAGVAGANGIQVGDLPGALGKIRGLAWLDDRVYATIGNAVVKVDLSAGKRAP
jgi:sugar lactone lactonase YvrE